MSTSGSGTVDSPQGPARAAAQGVCLQKIVFPVFRFFASLKLAVTLLVSLMIILAAGTIIESLHGAEAAQILVYEAAWFDLLLVLLAVNVLGATLDRLPWKKKHIGFITTHLGIILILAGSLVTRASMIDGQMPIAEGETESFITLPEPLIYVYSPDLGRDWIYPVSKKPFPWQGNEKLRTASEQPPFRLHLLHYYPKARVRESIEAASQGPAAVKLALWNSFLNQEQWLIEKDPRFGSVQMGPAKLVFTNQLLKESAGELPREGYLEFEFEDESVPIPLPEAGQVPFTAPLGNKPYRITVERILKNAFVEGRELVDQPGDSASDGFGKNPAVELTVEGNGIYEKHTVFARFPDFPTVHGMRPSATGARVFYRLPGSGSRGESHELRFVKSETGELLYQVKKGFEVRTGKAALNEDIETGWMDLKFRLEEYYPYSQIRHAFLPQPNTSEAEDLTSAVHVSIAGEKEEKRIWLRQGVRSQVEIDGVNYTLIYGQRRMPLGFKLELKDFKIEHYPGTEQPARFSSDVVLKDDMKGIVRDVHITMNEPLEHRGFKIYQAAYSLPPEGPEISVFAVGKDPGIPLKYAGAVIMITGIVTMFSMRRFAKRKQERENANI